jgi:hypothetical protein
VFDLRADGHPQRFSWPAKGSHNKFLVFDRDGDGLIKDGHELFGNVTYQTDCASADQNPPNGFKALREFDLKINGGNEDGWLDEKDAGFKYILWWDDENADGISQPGELKHLSPGTRFNLAYHEVIPGIEDVYHDWFRYKGEMVLGEASRSVYDVYLRQQPPNKPLAGASEPSGASATSTALPPPQCCNTCGTVQVIK